MKKSNGHIRKEITTVFEFITNNKNYHDIKLMCEVLSVATISYYKHLHKKPIKREIENKNIEKEIININTTIENLYGAPKINKSINALDIPISLKRTQRLMKKLGIKSLIVKK